MIYVLNYLLSTFTFLYGFANLLILTDNLQR